MTDTLTVNGRSYVRTFDAAKKQIVTKTPAGRSFAATLDNHGRMARVEVPRPLSDLLCLRQTGPADGDLAGRGRGRAGAPPTLEYDADGHASAITDPLKQKHAWNTTRRGE